MGGRGTVAEIRTEEVLERRLYGDALNEDRLREAREDAAIFGDELDIEEYKAHHQDGVGAWATLDDRPLEYEADNPADPVEVARMITPDRLENSPDASGPLVDYIYDKRLFGYNEYADPVYNRQNVAEAKSDLLYELYRLGKGEVSRGYMQSVQYRAAVIVSADEWLQKHGQQQSTFYDDLPDDDRAKLSKQERQINRTLRKLANPDLDTVEKTIYKQTDRRAKGTLAMSGSRSTIQGSGFKTIGEIEGAELLRQYTGGGQRRDMTSLF